MCQTLVQKSWFDNLVLFFIGLNCITLAMERPNIPPDSRERLFLATANYVFTAVFAVEMVVKVIASSMMYGQDAYFTSGWNVMDGSLVIISIVDLLMSLISASSPRIFGILRVSQAVLTAAAHEPSRFYCTGVQAKFGQRDKNKTFGREI